MSTATEKKSGTPLHYTVTAGLRIACERNSGNKSRIRRAWSQDHTTVLPYLAGLGVRGDDRTDSALLVAGAIGYGLKHEPGVSVGKMLQHLYRATRGAGDTMNPDPEKQTGNLPSAIRRLTASEFNRIDVLRPILMRCKNEGLALDHGMLLADLWYWDEGKARKWISDFYSNRQSSVESEAPTAEEQDGESESSDTVEE